MILNGGIFGKIQETFDLGKTFFDISFNTGQIHFGFEGLKQIPQKIHTRFSENILMSNENLPLFIFSLLWLLKIVHKCVVYIYYLAQMQCLRTKISV